MIQDYLNFTDTVAIYPERNAVSYVALGLAGETGEAVDCVKKIMRMPEDASNYDNQREKLFLELGDIQYYWFRMCREMGFDPEEVLKANIEKLKARQAQGTLHKR